MKLFRPIGIIVCSFALAASTLFVQDLSAMGKKQGQDQQQGGGGTQGGTDMETSTGTTESGTMEGGGGGTESGTEVETSTDTQKSSSGSESSEKSGQSSGY